MSKYAFTFKKDNIFVEFSTSDKDAVENQFQIWVDNAAEYMKKNPKKIAKAAPTQQEEKKPEEKKPAETKTAEKTKPSTKETKQPKDENSEKVFDKASSLLKTINNIQNPIEEEAKPEEKPQDFEEVLEKSIENPTFEPNKVKDQVFLNLINSKSTNDKFNYLIITAFYLSEFEKKEMFSLKQINAKMMHNLSEVIDHTTLQDAINQGLIELVPDLTGTSEIGEYRLTHQGEEYFANKI